nr:SDR family oxidoreductase [Ruegeria sp. PR1b]
MLEISKRNARMWSRMGIRAFYGQALSAIASENPNVLALSADLGRSSGLDRFSKEYPAQFLNTGIAEQNMVGVAAGLARTGFDVFASTFAPFASMRAAEQVRMNMGYMHEPVKLVALGSGLAMGFLGNSHYGLEDLAVMRAIPGLTVVSPADCAEIYKVLLACVDYAHPVYIRLTGAINCPVFEVNLFGPLLFTQSVVKKMLRAKQGSVVNIASTAGLLADAGTLSYGGSKAALIHATKVMARELGSFGIRVNAIAPSVVETEMATQMDASARAALDARSALPGAIEPGDVADLAAFLISEQSARITGQVMRIDRGLPF